MPDEVEVLAPGITLNLALPDGYYIYKSVRVDAERVIGRYLTVGGTWSERCTHGWFQTKSEALKAFAILVVSELEPVTNEDLRWEDRES